MFRPEDTPLGGEALSTLEEELRQVCAAHGVMLRKASAGTRTLREEERGRVRLLRYWERTDKQVVQRIGRCRQEAVQPKTIDEMRDAPLRSFTGFLIRADGGRDNFWESHGQAYVAKLQHLMAHTEDRAQRFNQTQVGRSDG